MAKPRAPLLFAVALTSGLVAALLSARGQAPDAEPGELTGLCEASAVLVQDGAILVGDNEAETSIYRFTPAFSPLSPLELSAEVEDIEAMTLTAEGELLIVGSQSANKSGARKPLRERVLVQGGQAITPDLSACAPCEAARGLPPKEGGLSIEGAVYWRGALWLGVRSPLLGGEAMLLRMAGTPTTALSVAEVVPVDLDGLGVRDLIVVDGALWALAGPPDGAKRAHGLYALNAPGEAPRLLPMELPAGAEGVALEDSGSLLVVTDGDGEPGKPCKSPATWARLAVPEMNP